MTTARTHRRHVGRGNRARARVVEPSDALPVSAEQFMSHVEEEPEVDVENFDYDPADHNIEDVKAYVEANPTHADAVLELELNGKARATLIEWFESRQEGGE